LKLLLDTSFLLELRRGNAIAREELRRRSEHASNIGVSALSVYELYLGAFLYYLKRRDASELAWLESVLGWLAVYPIDSEVAEVAARVKAEASVKGLQIPEIDLLIAASAGPDTVLLTFDGDHLAARELLSRYGVDVIHLGGKEG
jgi:predicted nucleic acid-binding protein